MSLSVNNSNFIPVFLKQPLHEKCPNGFIFGPYFPVFGLDTGKYIPEITPYLDTFHAVCSETWHANSGVDKIWAGSSSYISIHLFLKF